MEKKKTTMGSRGQAKKKSRRKKHLVAVINGKRVEKPLKGGVQIEVKKSS